MFVLCEHFTECFALSFKDLLVASPISEINGWITKHLYIYSFVFQAQGDEAGIRYSEHYPLG